MKLILRLYPKPFRDRYGDEVAMLLESSPTPMRDLLNVVWHALLDRTGYAVTTGWRLAPRFLGYGAMALLGAYALGYFADHARALVIKFVLAHRVFDSELFQMRLLTALCLAAGALLGFSLGRRYWRGSVGTPVAALALAGIVAAVLRVDAYFLSAVRVRVDWSWFGWAVGEQSLWAAATLLLVVAIRRSRRPGLVALFGVVAVAYSESTMITALVDWRYSLGGNPWTAYWENIMGAYFAVPAGGQEIVTVDYNGWWPTIATALVVGCTLASSRVPRTAQSSELVS